VRVERYGDADSFLARTGDFLSAREAEHNLILGLSSRLRIDPRLYGEEPYFAVALGGDRIVAVTMRTSPHNLIVSEVDDDQALAPLADDALDAFGSLPGVGGPRAAVERFVQLWQERTGAAPRVVMRLRIYRAEHVERPGGVPGALRPYEARDRELVISWMDAFVDEAMVEPPPETSAEWLERRDADPESGIVIWEVDRGVVSMGGYGGLTPNGIRIGPIYTPRDQRRRGYGSALTADLTHMLLERGRRFCFLYTDLANPTSNSIYQQIGYRPVSDSDQWAFEAPTD
jgi:predicted GNAT family acetyltransferase